MRNEYTDRMTDQLNDLYKFKELPVDEFINWNVINNGAFDLQLLHDVPQLKWTVNILVMHPCTFVLMIKYYQRFTGQKQIPGVISSNRR